jgi:hypothetical protein
VRGAATCMGLQGEANNQATRGNMREKKAARRGRCMRRQTALICGMQERQRRARRGSETSAAGACTQCNKGDRDPCMSHAGYLGLMGLTRRRHHKRIRQAKESHEVYPVKERPVWGNRSATDSGIGYQVGWE